MRKRASLTVSIGSSLRRRRRMRIFRRAGIMRFVLSYEAVARGTHYFVNTAGEMWFSIAVNRVGVRGNYERQNIGEGAGVAGASVCGVERYLRDAAHVDADCGKSAAGAKPSDKPLVGR